MKAARKRLATVAVNSRTKLLRVCVCVYLEQDVCAHGLAVSDNGLLVLSFAIPAVQLHTSDRMESTQSLYMHASTDDVHVELRTALL